MLSKKQEIIDVFQMIKNNDYEKMLPLINEVINTNDSDILIQTTFRYMIKILIVFNQKKIKISLKLKI